MRRKNYRGCRCEKRKMGKCKDVVRTFDKIQAAYADKLEISPNVITFQCNVLLTGVEDDKYTTDFVINMKDGTTCARECVFRRNLTKPMTMRLLDVSRNYWREHGIKNWGIVIEEAEINGE